MFNFKPTNARERPMDPGPIIQSENVAVTGASVTYYVGRDANTYNIQQHASRY